MGSEIERSLLLEGVPGTWSDKEYNTAIDIAPSGDGAIDLVCRAESPNGFSRMGHIKMYENGKGRYSLKRNGQLSVYNNGQSDEDPRIQRVDSIRIDGREKKDIIFLTFVKWGGKEARTHCAYGNTLNDLTYLGDIGPKITVEDATKIIGLESYRKELRNQENSRGKNSLIDFKDVSFFPKGIKGSNAIVTRIGCDMQRFCFNDISDLKKDEFWMDRLGDIESHEIAKKLPDEIKIGLGAPPINVKGGSLLFCHGVKLHDNTFIYQGKAMLLDSQGKSISEIKILEPHPVWGVTPDKIKRVVFPAGAVKRGDDYLVTSGAGDRLTELDRIPEEWLLRELSNSPLYGRHYS